jgi:tellurium resistance protein TerD
MAINLVKGQRVDIGLQKIKVGLGWEGEADLDASAFLVAASAQVPSEGFFVFYNNLESPDKGVIHSGDVKEGGAGDVETISVDIAKIDSRIEQIIFTVTIHEFEATGENFGQVHNSYIRIYDAATNEELCKYELDEDFSIETAIEFGRLYKRNGAWKFEALGTANSGGGLHAFVKKYATVFA